jgi:G3E family GTPase
MSNAAVPIYLVSGFLGSGKTTLISALLKQPSMAGTAVIVNEFGAVGIDDAIFAQSLNPDNVLLLANGCLCCTARDDLTATVRSILRRQDDPARRIVIETTGLADPVPVLMSLMLDRAVQSAGRPAGVVSTVDAVNGMQTLAEHAVASTQAAIADCRIITKSELADHAQIADLTDRLTALNPGARIRLVSHGAIAADDLFAATTFDPFSDQIDPDTWLRPDAYRSGPHRHRPGTRDESGDQPIRSWLIEETRPVDWTVLSPRLAGILGRYGDVLLRMKGIVHTVDHPQPLILHCVQRLFHPPVRLTRSASDAQSIIVVIGGYRAEDAVEAIRDALRETAR